MKQQNIDPFLETANDDLITLVIRRILEDKPLSDFDADKFRKVFFNAVLDFGLSEKEMKIRIKKFKQAIPNFLSKVSDELNGLEQTYIRVLKMKKNHEREIESLPKYTNTLDHPDVIKFARSLKDEHYSFSAAERLVGTTRQTLKAYAEKKLYGLQLRTVGKSDRLSKEDLINYYRQKNHKDYDPFEAIASGTHRP